MLECYEAWIIEMGDAWYCAGGGLGIGHGNRSSKVGRMMLVLGCLALLSDTSLLLSMLYMSAVS